MDIEIFIFLIILAIGIGFLASLFGIGGGFLLVPSMILLLDMETHSTVATVAVVICFMALSSTIAYTRQKRIDYKVTLILMFASIPGAILGALMTQFVSSSLILILFSVVETILALILGFKKTPQERSNISDPLNEKKKWYILYRHKTDAEGLDYLYRTNLLIAFPLSFLAGFLSSLLGIGGGTLYIQIYVFACGMSIHWAIASSMFSIFISTISSAVTFTALGQVDFTVALAFSLGIIIGAQLGAFVNRKIHSKYLKPMAAGMIIIIAIRMIILASLNI